MVERHMDQANWKVEVGGGEKNPEEEEISFNSAQIFVSSQRS